MPPRHVVVDGSNLATEGRSLPSLAQLDEAVRAFKEEWPDHDVLVVVDASFSYRIDESEREVFEGAENAGEVVSPPAGAIGRGDGFLLRIADRTDAVVLSNDSFQEFHGEYPWLFDEGRLVGGKPVPGVGWIFTPRSPVRGPKSRVAVRDARTKRRSAPVEPVAQAIAEATAEAVSVPEARTSRRSGRRRGRSSFATDPEAVNEPLPFITFIAEHRLGSEVEGTVDSFTSHGAFIVADGARCYAPVVGLADPPPRSAKDVLKRGEARTFVVQALDPPRRGIELALPGLAKVAGAPTDETVEAEIDVGAKPSRRRATRKAPEPEVAAEPAGPVAADEPEGVGAGPRRNAARRSPDLPEAVLPAPASASTGEDVPAAAAKRAPRPARKAATAPVAADTPSADGAPATRKAPARKTAATKAAAVAAVAAPAKKAAAPAKAATRRSVAATKSAPAHAAGATPGDDVGDVVGVEGDAPVKKAAGTSAARKRTAGTAADSDTASKKSATQNAPAEKAAVKKTPAKKAAAEKAPVKKAAAEKAAVKKTPAKKAAAKKAPVKKAAAKKAAVKKAPAEKAAAPTG